MSRQWKRVAQVIVGKGGAGLMVEKLRIKFEITKTLDATPNAAVIKIYNLTPANEEKIKNEYDEVLLNIGYEDSVKLVFRGNITHVYRYREGNDRITEIEAADGDIDYKRAIMNETLAAGTTNIQVIDRAVASFIGGTIKGHVNIEKKVHRRGKVLSGNTREILNNVAQEGGAHWSIQDGQLVVVPTMGLLPNEAVVINAETGMLGAPEINDKGIAVRCSLNPLLLINGKIQLNNSDIKANRKQQTALATKREKLETNGTLGRENEGLVRLDPDGIYKIIKLTDKGDTRGNEWESDVECVSVS